MRLHQRAGGYQIAVFTSPTPLRAGQVDMSVLVQDAATGECVPEADVTIRVTARESRRIAACSAAPEAATNRLFHAAVFELLVAGWWDVEIVVQGPHGPARVGFAVQVDEPAPRWLDLWPWFTWPAFVVALFGVHRILCRRPAGGGRFPSRPDREVSGTGTGEQVFPFRRS
jgi:hypothetical protein